MFFSQFLSLFCLSFRSLSSLSGCLISLLPSTPHAPASPRAFILAGCSLYENTPIGRQAPLSDTIHCTCIDMKSVLTSTAEFFLFLFFFLPCSPRKTTYQWRCGSCDQIKEAGGQKKKSLETVTLTSLSHVKVSTAAASRWRGKVCLAGIRGEFRPRKSSSEVN